MKLLRYKKNNNIIPAILDQNENIRDVSSFVKDWDGFSLNEEHLNYLKNLDLNLLPKLDKNFSFAPCLASVGKLICIGLNYSEHAEEMKMQIPEEPIIFMKATSSISGCNDDIIIPKNSEKLDWEVELGVIIGKKAKYVSEDEANKHIVGYCVINDVSERKFQIEHMGQWTKGKSCDTFGPIGPYVVTKEEIKDPQNLNIWLKLNGKTMQNSSTSKMIYKINYLVSYLSNFMTLNPGDIISTGSPSGTGMSLNPQIFLKEGDIVKLGIEGLGVQMQKISKYKF